MTTRSLDATDPPLAEGDEAPPAAIVLLSDGETVVGAPTAAGADAAAAAGIPVYAISFGTLEGTIVLTDPQTGESVVQPVPVNAEELAAVAERTGGIAYAAEIGGRAGDVYADIEQRLEPTLQLPEPELVELTVRYLAVALLLHDARGRPQLVVARRDRLTSVVLPLVARSATVRCRSAVDQLTERLDRLHRRRRRPG